MKKSKGNRNLSRFGALLVLVALWVITPFAIGDRTASAEEMMLSDVIRIGANLTGAPINGVTPTGFAEYRVDDQNRRRLDVDGFSINLPAGTVLDVSINNAVIGQTNVGACGTFFFRRRTDDGQQVPIITNGSPVQVLNAGTVVVAGVFGSASPSPSGSPTGSPSPSPTASPCASPSPSPTGSPNGTPSPSPTGSPNGTPSPSPTASPNGTPSPSPTGSPNPSPSPTGTPNAGELFAWLTGPTIGGVLPNGFAQYEIHSSRRELEVRVNQVNLGGGTQLTVIVDGANIGSMFLDGGEGRLRLRTDEGQTVPQVVAGSLIAIQSNGANIMSGIFAGFTGPSPSPSPSPSASPTPGGSPGPSPSPTASPSPGSSPSPSPSPALGRSFESNLTGNGVQTPVQTNATGEVKVTLNAAETQATIFGEFHNLGSSQTGARIEALIGDGVLVRDLGVVGGTNGTFATITMDVTPGQVSQIRAGLWSVVITSANNPGGEIRGKILRRSDLADFDGDGSNDLSLFRPSDGVWYSLNGAGFTSSQFGSAADKVVSADYDGDGRTDTAVFRSVDGFGIWQIKRSSDAGVSTEQFGLATDTPTRGDFDGDGINDLAVFRSSTGVWYIKKSSNTGFIITRFGLSEDKPIPADMDGDGKDDITVFRPSDGNWYWLRSSDGQFVAAHFGLNGDIPVRGDFDGDGKSDMTVYRPSSGIWYTLNSTNGGFTSIRFGLDGDIPVAGNYDNDGKTDIAVFRPSDGKWYILRSSDGGFQSFRFGLNGDIPTIAR